VVKAVERFDPEGLQEPEGEWRSNDITRAAESGADNGSGAMNSPGFGIETEPSGGVPDRTGSRSIFGEEAKGQVGSIDLVMVAKASLRASERPFRVSGSGRMQFNEDSFLALTRRALKGVAGERETMDQEHPVADRTPSMPVVRSIVP
jgi:hypothetical protein